MLNTDTLGTKATATLNFRMLLWLQARGCWFSTYGCGRGCGHVRLSKHYVADGLGGIESIKRSLNDDTQTEHIVSGMFYRHVPFRCAPDMSQSSILKFKGAVAAGLCVCVCVGSQIVPLALVLGMSVSTITF